MESTMRALTLVSLLAILSACTSGVIALDGSDTDSERPTDDEPELPTEPEPSPDGSLIAYCSNRQLKADPNNPHDDRDKDIWMMRADGSMAVRITDSQGEDSYPCWSPDGTHLPYTAGDVDEACHLRIVDVSDVVAAFATGDHDAVKTAASKLRHTKVSYDRTGMREEIGAQRHAIFLTSWIPEKWIKGLYPPGHFGRERNAHWV